MARSEFEIQYQTGRGVARAMIEHYLVTEGFKQAAKKNKGTYWYRKPGKSTVIQCLQLDFDVGKITLSAWITGVTPDSQHIPIGEEDLSGMRRLASKQKLRQAIKEIEKMF